MPRTLDEILAELKATKQLTPQKAEEKIPELTGPIFESRLVISPVGETTIIEVAAAKPTVAVGAEVIIPVTKETLESRSPQVLSDRAQILAEHGGLPSDVPIGNAYWRLPRG